MSSRAVPDRLIVDASVIVDLLLGTGRSAPIRDRLRGHDLHAPAHLDAEVLSALGRLERSGSLAAAAAEARLTRLAAAPLERHPLAPLLGGAWRRRPTLRLVDALYIELADRLRSPIVTTDAGLAAATDLAEYLG